MKYTILCWYAPRVRVVLVLNGYEIQAHVDEQEQIILNVASGACDREALAEWLESHISMA